MRNLLFLFIAAVVNLCAYAQASLDEIAATPGKAGGVYYAYPEPEILQTPAPAGYKPFYISHYGRHGSRYLISDNDYTAPRDILRRAADADALTPLGRDILSRLDSVWIEAQGRDKGPWYQSWRRFRAEQTRPERLVASIFSDSSWVATWLDPVEFMWQMYWVAVDMQNMETKIDFFDIFTSEELYSLWQVFNFNFFACNSSYAAAEGQLTGNARNLVCDIVAKADRCIASGEHGADFRFGHDGNIIPLAALMRLTNCYTDEMRPERLGSVWSDFKISPMASNLQMIFFRNKKGDILVKIMLNEREIAVDMPSATFPFYRWDDLRAYLLAL